MKLIALLALTAALASAADIRLAWSPSPSVGITNYALYAALKAPATNYVVNVGTNCTATLSDVQPGIWTFSVTAGKDGLQSAPCAPLTVEMAQPPEQLRTVVILGAPVVTASNWVEMGFFKLRVP